jgi:hypothetical protein
MSVSSSRPVGAHKPLAVPPTGGLRATFFTATERQTATLDPAPAIRGGSLFLSYKKDSRNKS